jgi:hypothetical protein
MLDCLIGDESGHGTRLHSTLAGRRKRVFSLSLLSMNMEWNSVAEDISQMRVYRSLLKNATFRVLTIRTQLCEFTLGLFCI